MKVVGIVVARLNSSRLPRKHFLDLAGMPLIERLFHRLEQIYELDRLVLATTNDDYNRQLVEWAGSTGRSVYAYEGDVNDLVARVDEVVVREKADIVAYFCGDSPLIEPRTVSAMIQALQKQDGADYAQLAPLPDGKGYIHEGFSVYRRSLWDRIAELSVETAEREHVGVVLSHSKRVEAVPVYVEEPPLFSLHEHRISVDTPADYRFMRELYRRWYRSNPPESMVSLAWVMEQLGTDPELKSINAHVRQKKVEDVTGKVLVLTQAGPQVGLGHLKRMLILASALREHFSAAVRLAIQGRPTGVGGLELVEHEWLPGGGRSMEHLERLVREWGPQAVVCDLRESESLGSLSEWLERLGEQGVMRVAVDGMFDRAEQFELIHVPSFFCSRSCLSVAAEKRSYGWSHYLLPPLLPRRYAQRPHKLLVLTGGSDAYALGTSLPALLESAIEQPLEIIWVKGPYAEPPRLPRSGAHHLWRLEHAPHELEPLFAEADLALTVHGVSLFEALHNGLPSVTFNPAADFDQEEWQALRESGIVAVADGEVESMEQLKQLLTGWDKAVAMGRAAAARLAGSGGIGLAGRIIDHIAGSGRD